MAYEIQIKDRNKSEQQHKSKKKVLAFHASSDTEDSDDEKLKIVIFQENLESS